MNSIILRGVKTHNLKNFDVEFPHRKFYVVTGVSGSGKSSLAFDTLYAEGQRRYVESLSAYARQFLERMEKPEVDFVEGIPPALALEAKNGVTNARSTVGTQTELNDYLRILIARIGKIFCLDCKTEVQVNDPSGVTEKLVKSFSGQEVSVLFRVSLGKAGKKYLQEFLSELEKQGFSEFWTGSQFVTSQELLSEKKLPDFISVAVDRLKVSENSKKRLSDSLESAFKYGKGDIQVHVSGKELLFSEELKCATCQKKFRYPTPNLFSFNSPLGACLICQGFGRVITIDWDLVVPDIKKSLDDGAIEPWTKEGSSWERKQLLHFCKKKKIPTSVPWSQMPQAQKKMILFGEGIASKDEFFSVKDFFQYLEKKTYKMHVRIFLSKYRAYVPCASCGEARLKPEALAVLIEGKNIYQLQLMTIENLLRFFKGLSLSHSEKEKSQAVLTEILNRLTFLEEVGLGYLTLARLSRTLSGGEVQRINLATSLGSALVDTLYVLDEPSIGLHERDNQMLIRILKKLRDLGNTVVVVEHDRTMIEAADELIDLGPSGGEKGGKLIFQGSPSEIRKDSGSLTGRYLSGLLSIEREANSRKIAKPKKQISIYGANEHNLKNLNADIPLNQMVLLTGVSGSGKSTLLYDVLYKQFLRFQGRPVQEPGAVKSIKGFEHIDDIVIVDQSPMGRSPRSNPATYLKVFDDIRQLFAQTPEARKRGYSPGHFSFNVDAGRCPSCKGDGSLKVEMHFLADVYVPCEACQGKRFKEEILEVEFQGKNLNDVLAMTGDDAIEFFSFSKSIQEKLTILQKVGLGYLRLGQSALTLSGGEAQRLKLAFELSQKSGRHVLYLFDEPTTGLHFHDIHYLLRVFEELLERGQSLIIIEHHLDLILAADTVIDLGPDGGDKGGEVVFQGPVEELIKKDSFTGRCLKKYLLNKKALQKGASKKLVSALEESFKAG